MIKSQFDRLVASLSTEERQEMLRKIEETFPLSPEPLAQSESREPEEDIDPLEYYYQADIFTRFYFFMVSLFTGRDKGDVVLRFFIGKLRRKINREYSDYFRLDKKQGLPPFFLLLNTMNNSLHSLREPLFMAMKEKEDFYVFLTNRVLGKKENEIYRETDPYQIEKDNPDFSVNQIHRQIDENYERIVKSLDEEKQRKLILYSVITRQLHSLVQFDFETLLKPFSVNLEGIVGYVELDKIISSLLGLNDILSSFSQPPDITLLKSLILFEFQKELADGTDNSIEEKLHTQIGSAVEGLNCIRDFNKKIPLTDLLKVLNDNINYQPTRIGGGEGALRHYKTYLKSTIDENFRRFVNDKKKRDLVKTLGATWGVSFIEPITGYRSSAFSLPSPFLYESSLSVLSIFISHILQEKYYSPLNLVQINGAFYRRDNRAEYTETYERLQALPGKIRNFTLSFLLEGSFYKRLQEAQRRSGDDSKEIMDRVDQVKQLADKEAKRLLWESMDILSSISSLLKGIIMGTGGAYDTLSNYSELGGTRNREFKNDLISLEFLVSSFHRSLLDIVSLEEKSAL
jgi:hypothetical protein